MVGDGQRAGRHDYAGAEALMKSNSARKTHHCPYCPYTSHFITNFKRHVTTHTGVKPFACPQCSYRSNSNDHLKRHMNTHRREKPYACTKCPYRASQKSTVTQHLFSHHGYIEPLEGPSDSVENN